MRHAILSAMVVTSSIVALGRAFAQAADNQPPQVERTGKAPEPEGCKVVYKKVYVDGKWIVQRHRVCR